MTSHAIVDFFSFFTIALMPLLTVRLSLSAPQVAMVIGIGSVCSGLIQPLVAYLSDRHDSRVFGTLGMAVAVVGTSSLGLVENFWQLLALQAISATGVGAFHPIAAAAIGSLAGKRRTRYVAAFFVAGMVGGILGNMSTPQYVGLMGRLGAGEPDVERGLHALLWLIPGGGLGVLLMAWSVRGTSHRAHGAMEHHARLTREERTARWMAVGVLFLGNVLRFCTNMALVYLMVQWATQLAQRRQPGAGIEAVGMLASKINGPMQGAQQVGMGIGGIGLGMLLSARFEKTAFCVFPFIGAVAIACLPWANGLPDRAVMPVAFAVTALAGLGFGSIVPVSVSLAQRLLPHRTSLASGLMMGGAWALAILGPHFAGAVQARFGLETAFHATSVLLACSGVLALALPGRLIRATEG